MKKLLVIILIQFIHFFNSQIINELKKDFSKTVNTSDYYNNSGIDLSISYPLDWSLEKSYTDHTLFSLKNFNKNIISSFEIHNIKDFLTSSEIQSYNNLTKQEVSEIIKLYIFPNSKNCSQYFERVGFSNAKNSLCKYTRIEGIESSMSSTFSTLKLGNSLYDIYYVLYQIPYNLKLIYISFIYFNVKDDENRYLADLLSSKIIDSVIIKNQ